jgi:hypothetical protein
VTHNPFSPPTADVADVADVAIEQPVEMPVQVMWVVRALWASIILNFVVAFVGPIIKWQRRRYRCDHLGVHREMVHRENCGR